MGLIQAGYCRYLGSQATLSTAAARDSKSIQEKASTKGGSIGYGYRFNE